MAPTDLRGVGVWSAELRYGDPTQIPPAAAELESLGYTALWVPDMGQGSTFKALDVLLQATSRITVATGILNIWEYTPQDVARWWSALPDASRDRLLLGVGVSHSRVVGEKWVKPLATMASYLDGLESEGIPLSQVCVAALGPKMLQLAGSRTAGAHPYFVSTAHTARAREALGSGLLAVEQAVVLDSDIPAARELARPFVKGYGSLPNYANNWKRLGFTDDEITTGADRLVDAMVACGDETAIADRVGAQFRAGADHVCIQVFVPQGGGLPREAWRRLAPG